jgi:hypothetical protein
MKTIENVTIYKCDFCKKELKRKHAMINHELKCDENPANKKACHFCEHLETIEKEVCFETHFGYGEVDYTDKIVKVFKCSKLDKLMFPFSIEKRGLHEKYDTFEEQEPMPNKCESFEEKSSF